MTEITKEFDQYFIEATAQWLSEWPWQWLKSQGYAESLLQSDALSPAGAKGIMQIMDETWTDITTRLRHIIPPRTSVFDAHWNIVGGVYYMALMRGGWGSPRPEEDRRRLALASYNAGFGNLLEAQVLSGGKNDYASIIAHLPTVTGEDNAKQTITYVTRIEQYYDQFTRGAVN